MPHFNTQVWLFKPSLAIDLLFTQAIRIRIKPFLKKETELIEQTVRRHRLMAIILNGSYTTPYFCQYMWRFSLRNTKKTYWTKIASAAVDFFHK